MKTYTYDCIVIGTGASGYNAANRLCQLGVNVAIVTEGINCGTSRNTGSDKQTYYKLGLSGDSPDSVYKMAQNLFAGGSVDGDNALCEAALSVRSFLNLCELGVGFPTNRYGEYIGYKTDHDPFERATSAGPLTSKYMTEALEAQAKRLGIPVFDNCKAVKILKHGDSVCGVLCVNDKKTVAFRCRDIVMATGGPAAIYADTVYPECHTGSSGLAIEAGAKMQNLALWQYGLASICPCWNVSGSYMQVLPRFVSIDKNGAEHDFLLDYYKDCSKALSTVFLKGYQWPFDEKKAKDGSSVIDLLVHRERVQKGRRVYLDFTKNPCDIDYSLLSDEAYSYLCAAKITFGRPIDRLKKMNSPAIELYKSKGVDLYSEYLEIALCAQHSNGGVAVDMWWQSSVRGLFAVGECAGTHGFTRPGGSALNAGQVGSLRAAQYISRYPNDLVSEEEFLKIVSQTDVEFCDCTQKIADARQRMSACAAAVRDIDKIKETLSLTLTQLNTAKDPFLKDMLLTQAAVLSSMAEQNSDPSLVQQLVYEDGKFNVFTRPVRPIPDDDAFFENIWRDYRQNKNIY